MAISTSAHLTGRGGEHPEPETLAAYLDGRLPAAERAEVEAHLAACPACFGFFADTAETLRDLAPAGEKVVRFPFERRAAGRRWGLGAAAAAAMVLAAAGTAVYLSWLRTPRIEVAEVVAPLAGRDWQRDDFWGMTYRGPETKTTPPIDAQSFLLGAHLVQFQVAVETENPVAAQREALEIASLLEATKLYPEEAKHFSAARDALPSDERELTPEARGAAVNRLRLDRELVAATTPAIEEGFTLGYLDFGKWAAAARLSAIAGDRTFFARREHRRFLRLLLEDPERLGEGMPRALPEEVTGPLEKVAMQWNAARAGEETDELRNALTAVLDHYERLASPPPPTG